MNAPTVTLHFTAPTTADLLAQVRAFGSDNGGLAAVSPEALLAELRDRMAKQVPPMVVRVEQFAPEGTATEEVKTTRTRRKATADEKVSTAIINAATVEQPGTVEVREEPKPVEAAAQEPAADDWSGGDDAKPVPTLDDVKLALNGCAAVHGQAATREVMQKHGGARLMDVKAENYGALIAALDAKAKEAPAQAQAA